MIKKNLSFDESHEFNSLKIFSALFRDALALLAPGYSGIRIDLQLAIKQ